MRKSLFLLCTAAALSATAGCTNAHGSTGQPTPSATTSTTPATSASSTTSATATVDPPVCGSADIAITGTEQSAGSGHLGVILEFRNVGSKVCAMRGYPDVDLLDAAGDQGPQARKTLRGYQGGVTGPDAPVLFLSPGESASAVLEALAFDAQTGANCETYPTIGVTGPRKANSVSLSISLPGCDVQVHPVVLGTTGQG